MIHKPYISSVDRIVETEEDMVTTHKWSHAEYIAHGQIQNAIDDPEVTICDIEADEGSPVIYLQFEPE